MEVLSAKYNLSLSSKETIQLIRSYYTNLNSMYKPRVALSLFTNIALDIEKILSLKSPDSHTIFQKYVASLDEVSAELGDPIDHIFDCLFNKVLISYIDKNKKEITQSAILKGFVDNFEPLAIGKSNIGNIGFEFFKHGKLYKVSYLDLLEIIRLEVCEN